MRSPLLHPAELRAHLLDSPIVPVFTRAYVGCACGHKLCWPLSNYCPGGGSETCASFYRIKYTPKPSTTATSVIVISRVRRLKWTRSHCNQHMTASIVNRI